MASLLLIGGTGFFGKSILDSFQRGALDQWGIDRVIAMSRYADALMATAPQLIDSHVELVNADIGKVESLPMADYVIHAAASTDARNYLTRPEAERKNIQAGVYNYCHLAPIFHRHSKIVYVSSGAVYGTQPPALEMLPEDYIVPNQNDIPEGKRDYAIAKRDAENAFKNLCVQGLAASIARCFAFVGPWLPRNQHFAIGNFIKDGLSGLPIKVKATYPVYRSYMHSDDLVTWLMTLAEYADTSCQAYNVGSDVAVTMGELAQLVAKQFGVEAAVPIQTENKVDRYIPSIEKARSKLGLELKFSLEEALRTTIASIRA